MARLAILVATLVVAAGCLLVTEPWTLGDGTPVSSFGGGDDYPRGNFGEVVAAGKLDDGTGVEKGYLAISAGARSPSIVYGLPADGSGAAWSLDHFLDVCKPLGDLLPFGGADETCQTGGTGAALAWIPAYASGSTTRSPCLVVGETSATTSGGRGRIALYCGGATFGWAGKVDSPGASGFGRSVALLQTVGADRILVGALETPAVPTTEIIGDAYVSTEGDSGALIPTALPWAAATHTLQIAAGARVDRYGFAVAAGRTEDGAGPGYAIVSATGSQAGDPSRIYFFRPVDATPQSRLAVADCAEGGVDLRFGTGMATADFDGDGDDELLARAPDGVSLYAGAGLAGLAPLAAPYSPAGCVAFDATTGAGRPLRALAIPCEPDPTRAIECSAEYGDTLATGDVDGDTVAELFVADPGAGVEGAGRAGAVHVFDVQFAAGSWAAVRVGLLADASPQAGQRLGKSMAFIEGAGRAEPFIGAPGTGEVFVFYCTGAPGDAPNDPGLNARCLPL